MNNLALNPNEKKEILRLKRKSFDNLKKQDQNILLTLAAKDFSKRFGETIRELANE